MPSNDYFNVLRPSMQFGVDYRKMRIAAFRGNLNIQLLGGHVQVISTTASEALEQVKAGKMRLLATSAPSPQDGELKGVPHWRGIGIDMQILHWRGLFAPAGTPPEVVAFWDERLGKLMKTEAWKKVLAQYNWADAFADSAQFRRELVAEREVTAKLLRELGFAK
jgi:tripartite-type tricarboxylate transporter receptor subunit TctC